MKIWNYKYGIRLTTGLGLVSCAREEAEVEYSTVRLDFLSLTSWNFPSPASTSSSSLTVSVIPHVYLLYAALFYTMYEYILKILYVQYTVVHQ